MKIENWGLLWLPSSCAPCDNYLMFVHLVVLRTILLLCCRSCDVIFITSLSVRNILVRLALSISILKHL